MARAFKLPDLGEGIHEGEVLSVRVAAGDKVKEGDIILEVRPTRRRLRFLRLTPGSLRRSWSSPATRSRSARSC